MDRFFGIIGIITILLIAFLMSNNKKLINLKTVFMGLLLQVLLAVFILKVPFGQALFKGIGVGIEKILQFSLEGAKFMFGPLVDNPERFQTVFGAGTFVFAIQLLATLIFVMVIVNILYYYGIMQRIVAFLGKIMNKLMDISGAEALSNIASPFVGQVSAQIMIKQYLPNLTRSEILASMAGSMACISAGVMAIYVGWGIPAEYLLAASMMAAPGAMVIAKIVYPEDREPETKNEVKISKRKTSANVLDAIAKGANEGMKISLTVIAMLISLVALISMIDFLLAKFGLLIFNTFHVNCLSVGIDLTNLSMKMLLGKFFSIFAYLMGVAWDQAGIVGQLMGTKFILNETIGYMDLVQVKDILTPKSFIIASFALCGFANVGSIATQIGGIGEIAPKIRKNLTRLGVRALICGTLASYLSACIAGILL
jgi:concentrative nucleoside transporter, CNT family